MTNHKLLKLPKDWVRARLGEISILGTGSPAPQGKEYFENGVYPFVRVQDMGNLGNKVYIHDTRDHINAKAIKKMKLFPKGSVLFTKSGMSILLNQRAIVARDMCIVSHIGISIPLAKVPSEWIYYWLRTLDFKNLTHATTLPSLQLSKVREISVPLPPLLEQHRIVAKIEDLFTRLDAGVEALKKVKEQLKNYRQAVLKYAFEGKLTEEWRHNYKPKPAEKLLEKIKAERQHRYLQKMKDWNKAVKKWESEDKKGRKPAKPRIPKELPPLTKEELAELPELPEGWVWVRVGEICFKIIGGGTPSTTNESYWSGDIPWITSADIKDLKRIKPRKFINENAIKESATNLLPKGNIVVVTRVGLGKVASNKFDLCFSQDSQGLILCNLIFNEYVLWKLSQAVQIFKYRNQGTTINGVTKKQLEELIIPICSLGEQRRIVQEIETRFSVADKLEQTIDESLKKSEALRQSILKKAFEGELTKKWRKQHPELISGENSAKALLEKIKREKTKQDKQKKKKGKRNGYKNMYSSASLRLCARIKTPRP